MNLEALIRVTAILTVLGTGVVYGTDVFCAMVLRPALARVDDHTLVTVTGHIHRFGDRRMPIPGVLGILAAGVSTIAAVAAGDDVQAIAAGTALIALLIWLVVYTRLSAPINRELTAAAESGRTLPNGRALQARWDAVINARAALQGLAVAASCLVLLT
ncbi:hypothetical protein MMAD_31990 [Mycolicibacterium madagascariense]|uniref:DUF1772 domain-containing protein n=1 Tax=Mycolicibacterium madagascariense TaxID=212765 RepID=A0A7I7XIA1_9MYCO|nr:DUF1772 domain-containing protein [Mycolicibacterium madagascariense]MCV7012760.1 DUF1772 domain-containing protein [Mycolicibacterium madagascariense]BBZ28904.1 hypothetical protein MMAD_31990 [Mycolicibacterium madagascariense]